MHTKFKVCNFSRSRDIQCESKSTLRLKLFANKQICYISLIVRRCSDRLQSAVLLVVFPGCWNVINDMHGYGGSPVQGVTTVSTCQAVCLLIPSCVAIDYDHNNTRTEHCWLLRNNLLPMIGSAPGITHYVLNRNCAGKL